MHSVPDYKLVYLNLMLKNDHQRTGDQRRIDAEQQGEDGQHRHSQAPPGSIKHRLRYYNLDGDTHKLEMYA